MAAAATARQEYSQVAEYTAAVFEQGAKNGDPEALWSYAYCLRMGGEHTAGNPEAAHEWFKQAVAALIPLANAGDAKAQYRLGVCYKNGFGCESASPAVASQWLSLATPGLKVLAEAGDPKAANYYGTVLTTAYAGELHWCDKTVLYWKEAAARQGHAPAHTHLAQAREQKGDTEAEGFHILESMRGGMKYGFKAAKKSQEMQDAIEKIKATEVCGHRREQLGAWVAVATGQPGEGIEGAPRSDWVPDTMSKTCCQCNAAFGIMRRRHHCRTCGLLVCSQCTASHAAVGKVCTMCDKTLLQYRRLQERMAGAATAVQQSQPVTTSASNSNPQGEYVSFCVSCGKQTSGAAGCQDCAAPPVVELPVLASGDVAVGEELGSGNFGKVHEGVCRLSGGST
eukprot:gene29359-12297_t